MDDGLCVRVCSCPASPAQREGNNNTIHLLNSPHQGLDTEPREAYKSSQTQNYYIKLFYYEKALRGHISGTCWGRLSYGRGTAIVLCSVKKQTNIPDLLLSNPK